MVHSADEFRLTVFVVALFSAFAPLLDWREEPPEVVVAVPQPALPEEPRLTHELRAAVALIDRQATSFAQDRDAETGDILPVPLPD